MDIVSTRGKMHNPVTDSGGVLIGKVIELGKDAPAKARGLKVALSL